MGASRRPLRHGPRESGVLSGASREAGRGVAWTEPRLVDNVMRSAELRRMDYVIGMCGGVEGGFFEILLNAESQPSKQGKSTGQGHATQRGRGERTGG